MDVIACDKKSTKSISNDKLESIDKNISKMSEEIEKLRTNSISIKDISNILAETTKNIENIIKDNSSISTDSKDLILE
jgi:coenzyme F420-reducing hydrogenase delta subunit